ncbi:MAG: 6-phosphofructokinase [Longimicrobiales bacterium]
MARLYSKKQMRIAISTSGGDAPGLNAVIRAATMAACEKGHLMFGLREGFRVLLDEGTIEMLDPRNTEGIERMGGTMLGAASGGDPFKEGRTVEDVVGALERHGIDALIMAGGDGTMQIADEVARAGIQVIGVPKTIDRDVVGTWTTFGFDTAVANATDAIDKLHTTAEAHQRLFTVEVMGRDTGWIALYSGIGGGAQMIAIPEFPYDIDVFAEHIRRRETDGHRYHILVCSEGARAKGGETVKSERTGRYSGIAEQLAAELSHRTGKEARSVALGHVIRGGAPTVFDRVLGLRFGSAAVSALSRGESGVMVAFNPPGFRSIPLSEVANRMARVTPDEHALATARNLGISFGI